MTESDKSVLHEKAKKLKAIIREQHKIKKDQRDERLIADTKERLKHINTWLNPPADAAAKVRMMTLEEFKSNFKKELEIKEPSTVMVIDTVEQLREIWPRIKTENIQIRAPLKVKLEAKRLAKEDSKKIKRKGFR